MGGGIGFTLKVWQATKSGKRHLIWQALFDLASANLKINRSGVVTALPRFARLGRDWIYPESLASDEVWQATRSGKRRLIWQALLYLASANLKSNRSGVVTALPRFARPGMDWIHPESLASDEV